MSTSSLTINIPSKLKTSAQKKTKADGVTLTFVVTQAIKAYNEGSLKFGLVEESDDEITASFDVSTPGGKKACIESFQSLMKK